jgi:hypothetical protein
MSVMMRPILCTLALVAAVVLPGTTAQPALADTEANVAHAQVSALFNDWNGSTFNFPSTGETCSQFNAGGNCWWWAANAWMALISWADENPTASDRDTIRTDLNTTYKTICDNSGSGTPWGSCPTTPDQHGKDPFTINTNNATYFDDIGWWATTWLAGYKFTGNLNYLYLAEELWNYATDNGYFWGALPGECGGVVQFHKTDSSGNTLLGQPDTFANALYLRDSAWLYALTQNSRYMQGITTSWSSGSKVGGALYAASWIRQHLIFQYNSTTLGTDGARFMMADHVDSSCNPQGNQTFLHAQGAMVNAWTDMSNACSTTGAGCSATPIYYDHLAEELARSVISDKLQSNGTWPFESGFNGSQGQKEPTVDTNGILSEMCIPTTTQSDWPRDCPLGNSIKNFQSYLIAKGIFERAVYCVQSNIADTTLANFVSNNAQSLANTLNFYGFLWDSTGANDPVNFATRASILEGLDADLGQGHFGMC